MRPTTIVALTLAAGLAAIATAQTCEWAHVPTPPPPGLGVTPFDIDGSGPNDVWVVGELITGKFPSWRFWNFAMRYDGSAWTVVPVPNPDPNGAHNELLGVVAVSATEAYAAGSTKYLGAQQAQILAWNGTEWSVEALNLIDDFGFFSGMGRAGDVPWAVGERGNPAGPPFATGIALSARRAGDEWIPEPVPPLAVFGGRSTNALRAIDGVSADDAWAVGDAHQTYNFGENFGPKRYAVHWNGTEWTLDDSLPDLDPSFLNDVAMVAPDDVWAVGYYLHTGQSGNSNQPWILHYDGSRWTMVDLPLLGDNGGLLTGIAARGPDEIYALGVKVDADHANHALIYRYDGVSWQEMAGARTDGTGENFMAAASVPGDTAWGLGLYVSEGGPLTEHLVCNACPADFDGNGTLDIRDFFAFQSAYAQGDSRADLDGNGTLDIRDFFAFQAAFAEGC